MEWNIIHDPATVAAALTLGEVDYWDLAPMDVLSTLRRNGVAIGAITPFGSFAARRPNALFPPFDNPKARQALALLVDQSAFMQAAVGDTNWWRTCFAFYVCGSPFETATGSEPYRRPDQEKARTLMQEAGYHGERLVVLSTPDVPIIDALSLIAVDELKSIGVVADVQEIDAATFITRQRDRRQPGPGSGGWNLLAVFFAGPHEL